MKHKKLTPVAEQHLADLQQVKTFMSEMYAAQTFKIGANDLDSKVWQFCIKVVDDTIVQQRKRYGLPPQQKFPESNGRNIQKLTQEQADNLIVGASDDGDRGS